VVIFSRHGTHTQHGDHSRSCTPKAGGATKHCNNHLLQLLNFMACPPSSMDTFSSRWNGIHIDTFNKYLESPQFCATSGMLLIFSVVSQTPSSDSNIFQLDLQDRWKDWTHRRYTLLTFSRPLYLSLRNALGSTGREMDMGKASLDSNMKFVAQLGTQRLFGFLAHSRARLLMLPSSGTGGCLIGWSLMSWGWLILGISMPAMTFCVQFSEGALLLAWSAVYIIPKDL
jgi:hypothetical protein